MVKDETLPGGGLQLALREFALVVKYRFEIGPGATRESQSQIHDIQHNRTEFLLGFYELNVKTHAKSYQCSWRWSLCLPPQCHWPVLSHWWLSWCPPAVDLFSLPLFYLRCCSPLQTNCCSGGETVTWLKLLLLEETTEQDEYFHSSQFLTVKPEISECSNIATIKLCFMLSDIVTAMLLHSLISVIVSHQPQTFKIRLFVCIVKLYASTNTYWLLSFIASTLNCVAFPSGSSNLISSEVLVFWTTRRLDTLPGSDRENKQQIKKSDEALNLPSLIWLSYYVSEKQPDINFLFLLKLSTR